MFIQVLNPLGNLGLTVLAALIPILVLLVLLAVFRVTAWLATLIGSILTLIVAIALWRLPLGTGIQSYLIGSANGVWAVDWITFWGLIIFNTSGSPVSSIPSKTGWSSRLQRMYACKRFCWPGPWARCWKGWSVSAIPGP